MLSRRTIILGAAGLAGSAAFAAAPPRVIYVGGLDCRPCDTWKKKYKADWLASPEYRQVTWIEIDSLKLREAYQERFWPGDLRPILDQLPRRSGTPRFLLVRDGRVIANEFGVSGWTRIVDALRHELVAGSTPLRGAHDSHHALTLRSGPTGRVSKGGQHQDCGPPFETHRFAMLLRVRRFW